MAELIKQAVVLLAGPGESLPFDIDLSPVLIDGTEDDSDAIVEALDEMKICDMGARNEWTTPRCV